ncbi:hypothetical protein [Mahella sp.]|uniref:hypothetical protein n=1 Tax=Mahella sp. TaxID=2798721 RepID=UPI0025C4A1E6|nr:hypothetical protein [Mahella sp.]
MLKRTTTIATLLQKLIKEQICKDTTKASIEAFIVLPIAVGFILTTWDVKLIFYVANNKIISRFILTMWDVEELSSLYGAI